MGLTLTLEAPLMSCLDCHLFSIHSMFVVLVMILINCMCNFAPLPSKKSAICCYSGGLTYPLILRVKCEQLLRLTGRETRGTMAPQHPTGVISERTESHRRIDSTPSPTGSNNIGRPFGPRQSCCGAAPTWHCGTRGNRRKDLHIE